MMYAVYITAIIVLNLFVWFVFYVSSATALTDRRAYVEFLFIVFTNMVYSLLCILGTLFRHDPLIFWFAAQFTLWTWLLFKRRPPRKRKKQRVSGVVRIVQGRLKVVPST